MAHPVSPRQALLALLSLPAVLAAAAWSPSAQAASTVCQAQAASSYCSDQTPGSADAAGYHNLPWVNLNKSLVSIAVSDNQVWGIDSAQVLWYLPNFKTGTTWIRAASGVAQVSSGHNLVCQISTGQHVLCAPTPPPPASAGTGAGSLPTLNWFDAGATSFKQIAVSAGTQFWGVDTSGNLVQVKDYTQPAATSTTVASGVQQVAVDGRGLVCQVNTNQGTYCSSGAAPAATAAPYPYFPLPWFKLASTFKTISVADGQLWGVDANGNAWQVPDPTNAAGGYPIAAPGVGTQLSAASAPSQFVATAFASDEVAVLMFMGQSNAVGYNTLPGAFIAPASPNVWGVKNAGWNFLPGNTNGTTPYAGSIASISAVQWTAWQVSANGPDMNLGFNSNSGAGANAANFAAFQWQGLVYAGWKLPDLYIVHIGWPSQGIDAQDTTTANVPWTTHGVNLWQPGLGSSQMPSYALAPFARTIMTRGLQAILASGKKPRLLALQWNQWEAEAGNANPVVISNAPANYASLVSGFNSTLGVKLPVQFVKPLSTAYSASLLAQMQAVFSNLAASDPANLSVIDVSQVSSAIFSGGVLGGGDGAVHYNLDTQQWFGTQSMAPCLVRAQCGVRLTTLPGMTASNGPVNLALGKAATQSSTILGAAAGRAVDGNTDGNWANGSVTHTAASAAQDWWQVDLGQASSIQSVVLWNRTDCCADRLSNAVVFVSASDMSGRTLAQLNADPSVAKAAFSSLNGAASISLPLPSTGRYVRVQLTGSNNLSLAEVQVMGWPAGGLAANYFNGTTPGGTPALQRTENIDFDWGAGSPGAAIAVDNFSASWTGWLFAPVSGSYSFATVSDDGVRVWINGTLVIDNWTPHGPTTNTASGITLSAGQRVSVRVEYFEATGGATVRWLWQAPGGSALVAVPAAVLSAN